MRSNVNLEVLIVLLPSVRVKYLCEENLDIFITRACDMQFSESDEFCITLEHKFRVIQV